MPLYKLVPSLLVYAKGDIQLHQLRNGRHRPDGVKVQPVTGMNLQPQIIGIFAGGDDALQFSLTFSALNLAILTDMQFNHRRP